MRNNCEWCGGIYETNDTLRDRYCSEKCNQDAKGRSSGGFGPGEAAVLAALVMFLMGAVAWLFKQARRLAPHVGRESSIALRKAQIKKFTSIDLHRELSLVGKAVSDNRGAEAFAKRYQHNFADVDALEQEIAAVDEAAVNSIVGGVKSKAKTKLLERKLRLVLAEIGGLAVADLGAELVTFLPASKQVLDQVASLSSRIKSYEDEIANLRKTS